MSRFRQGLRLGGISWRVLRANPSLMAFPVVSGILALPVVAVLVVPGILLAAERDAVWPAIVLFAIAAYAASFVAVFFSVALCACADRAFRGEQFTFGDGVGAARARLWTIARWALIVWTVAMVIRLLQDRFEGIGGAIAAALAGLAWSLVSFLAIPVITLEDAGPVTALKRSASLFRRRWGQQVTGEAVTGGVVGVLIVLPGVLLMLLGAFMLGNDTAQGAAVAVLAVGVVVVVVGSIIAGTLGQVLSVAVYRFAETGDAVGPYPVDALESVVRPRRGCGAAAGA